MGGGLLRLRGNVKLGKKLVSRVPKEINIYL